MTLDGVLSVLEVALKTLRDVAPIAIVLVVFLLLVLRRPLPSPRRQLTGFAYVLAGLALFVVGLENALFPIGKTMAEQLTEPSFLLGSEAAAAGDTAEWWDYYWVYAFAAAIGFATTIAEPSLIAVAIKAEEVSGGTIVAWRLRLTVAVGVSASVALGAFRIVTGTPLEVYIIAGYLIVIVQTLVTPRSIVPLAYDSGGVTTSTVTVPLVTALGLGLAASVPGRSPLLDGFGLIALASLFPLIAVMGYGQLAALRTGMARRGRSR